MLISVPAVIALLQLVHAVFGTTFRRFSTGLDLQENGGTDEEPNGLNPINSAPQSFMVGRFLRQVQGIPITQMIGLSRNRKAFRTPPRPVLSMGSGPRTYVVSPNSITFSNSLRLVPTGSDPQTKVVSQNSVAFGNSLRLLPTGHDPQTYGVSQNSVAFGNSLRLVPTGSQGVSQNSNAFGTSHRLVPTGPNPQTHDSVSQNSNTFGTSLHDVPTGFNPITNTQTNGFYPNSNTFISSLHDVPSGNNPITNTQTNSNAFGSSFAQSGLANSGVSVSNQPMSKVGKCVNRNIHLYTNANFRTLSSENNGFWVYSAVPSSSEFDHLTRANLHSQPTSTQNNYILTIYTQFQNEQLKTSLKLAVIDTTFGYSTASTIGDNVFLTFKIFVVDYARGRYTMFYICCDDVDDIQFDYRYIVTHGSSLTNQERSNLHQKDSSNSFRGSMVML